MNALEYYIAQSQISGPGKYKNDLPNTLSVHQLCDLINNLILIDFLDNMKIIKAPETHKGDINIRNIEEKIDLLFSRNKSEITQVRKNENKIMGNCRDTSLLLCTMLREKGVAARVRSGFSTIFSPKKKYDHWLCEYWDFQKKCWIKVDTWMYQIQHYKDILPSMFKKGLEKLNYNPLDVDDNYFIPGGCAWHRCQNQGEDPNSYGTYGNMKGLWFIRDNMLRDLLCLNKIEPLPWDCWGLMSGKRGKVTNQERDILNHVAFLLSDSENNFDKIKEFYASTANLHIN